MANHTEEDPPITADGASARNNTASEAPRPSSEEAVEPGELSPLPPLPIVLSAASTAALDPPESSSLKSVIIDAPESSSASHASFVRGHRRRSTQVSRSDLEKFRREVLGVETYWNDDEEAGSDTSTSGISFDRHFESLNRAFDSASMSMNSGNGVAGGAPAAGMFSNYADNQSNPSMPSTPRQSMSSSVPPSPGQMNGGGMPGMNGGMPMNAGHQMDLHHLYEMVLELSDVLKNNREVTKSIVNSAEEIMVRYPAILINVNNV